MRIRYTLQTELWLILLPTVSTLAVVMLLNAVSRQEILFTSLASSAFLIYVDPLHEVNSVRTLLMAQISAALIGYCSFLVAGGHYLSIALAMVGTIVFMLLVHALHPPALSTALVFSWYASHKNSIGLFIAAILILVLLVVIQQLSVWLIKKEKRKSSSNHPHEN